MPPLVLTGLWPVWPDRVGVAMLVCGFEISRWEPSTITHPRSDLPGSGGLLAMAAVGSYRVAAVGVCGWAPKTQPRCRSALSALASFEGARALQTLLTDTLSEFLASLVSLGRARSTLRAYDSAVWVAEDVRLLPRCVRAIHWRLAKSGEPTPGLHYMGPCELCLLWSGASSPKEQAVAALACLGCLLFLRVSEALSITPAGLESDSVVMFVTTKVGGHKEVRRPLYGWGRSWVRLFRAYACIPEGQPLVPGGVEAVEKTFVDLLRDSPYDRHRWHNLQRGGAAAAFHRSPNVPYFVWWGRWRRQATAPEYALGYSAVVGALDLPLPVGDQTAPGGWLCSWRTCGVMPCTPHPRGRPVRRSLCLS